MWPTRKDYVALGERGGRETAAETLDEHLKDIIRREEERLVLIDAAVNDSSDILRRQIIEDASWLHILLDYGFNG